MTLSLIFFILSGFVMMYLIVHKHMEIVYGRGLIVKTLLQKGDSVSHKGSNVFRRVSSLTTRRNLVLMLNYILVVFLRTCILVGSHVRKWMTSILDRLIHKREVLTHNGAASAYLKQISENKQNTSKGGGKIVEDDSDLGMN